jgi:Holliday junction resolvase RusA-like endonuclease
MTDLPKDSWYAIAGINPEPWEASEASVGRKDGRTFVQFHRTRQMRAYQDAIKEVFPKQNPEARIAPEKFLDVHFYFWRELAAYDMGTGKKRRMHVADATNLAKGLEDALQGFLYTNDKNNIRVTSEIVEQSPDTTPFILVQLKPYLPDPTPWIMRGTLEVEEPAHTPEANMRDVPDVF